MDKLKVIIGLAMFTLLFPIGAIADSVTFFEPPLIGLIQYDPAAFGEFNKNNAELTEMANQLVLEGADLILLPEGAIDGYYDSKKGSISKIWCRPEMNDYYGVSCGDVSGPAQTVPSGQYLSYWENFAIGHNVYVIMGIPLWENEEYYNAAFVFGPEGFMTLYKKNHLFWTDKGYATAGVDPQTVDLPFGKFGLMICADVHYSSQLFNHYAQVGVDAILAIGFGISAPHFRANLGASKIQKAFYADPWDSGFLTSTTETRPFGENQMGVSLYRLDGTLVKSIPFNFPRALEQGLLTPLRFYQL